ncbi:MAG: class I SAM-dependent methyltransferase [Candidatus Nanopelagicales bacterium]
MKSRLPVVALGVVLAGLFALLALALQAPVAAVAVAAVIGLVLGGVLGQALMWLRTSVGRVARIENTTGKRLEEMRATAAKRHEMVFKASREARDRAADAEREAKRAASAVPRVQEAAKQQRADLRDMRLSIVDRVDDQVVLLEDYIQLMRLVPMPLPMPRPGTWAASEDLLLWLAGHVLEHRPRVVVDLGSGQSSVWMAGAMRTAGYDGKVIGVDHDEVYAQATRDLARRQGVESWLSVVHAPLREQTVEGRDVRWYDVDALADVGGIDLLCIDGPPGQGTAQARWAALPVLVDRLADGATVVLDDMIRRDEQEILEDWLATYPGFSVERLDFEKGAAILRRSA